MDHVIVISKTVKFFKSSQYRVNLSVQNNFGNNKLKSGFQFCFFNRCLYRLEYPVGIQIKEYGPIRKSMGPCISI